MARRKRFGGSAESANLEASSEGLPVPVISWEELVARAMASLDEPGVESHARRVVVAKKISARNAERGVSISVDVKGVRRALVAYYTAVSSGSTIGILKIFKSYGVAFVDYRDGRKTNPEFTLVMEYIKGVRDELAGIAADELKTQAQEAQRRLVTEAGCELNQRAVEFSLRATMRDVYGTEEKPGGSDSKKAITYSFPNMTVNWVVAPSELSAPMVEEKPEPETIDV